MYLCISENNKGFTHTPGEKPMKFNAEDPLNEETLSMMMQKSRLITRAEFESTLLSNNVDGAYIYKAMYLDEIGAIPA